MAVSLDSKPYLYSAMQTVAEKAPSKLATFKQQVNDLERRLNRVAEDGKVNLAELTDDFAKLYANSAGLGDVQQVFFDLIAKAINDVAPSAKQVLMNAHTAFSATSFKETAAVGSDFKLGNKGRARDLSKLQIEAKPIGRDASSEITDARIKGDTLEIDVRFAGGLAEHQFQLSWGNGFLESMPVKTGVQLSHNDNGDSGKTVLSQTLKFDLTPMKATYKKWYQESSGTISLFVPNFKNLLYTF